MVERSLKLIFRAGRGSGRITGDLLPETDTKKARLISNAGLQKLIKR